VIINSRLWSVSDYFYKKVLLLHEIGHCVFDLDHIDTSIHIMNTNSIVYPGYDSSKLKIYKNFDLHLQNYFATIKGEYKNPLQKGAYECH
jgi:hypothetical protein